MIQQLLAVLDEVGVEIDAEGIADALWLARARREESGDGGRQPASAVSGASTEPRPPDAEPQDLTDDTQAEGADYREPDKATAIRQAGSDLDAEASLITFGKARALPGTLELGRALRPLKQRHPSKRRRVLNTDATVNYFCDTGVLTPVMLPGAERWFDIDLLVDVGLSMAVWQDTVAEFVSFLQRHGAFREVRRWNLEQADGKVRLSRAADVRSEAAQLEDPNARRLMMLVTDCIGPMWYQAPIWDAIRRWGQFSPVVVISPLPSRLWPWTAVGSPEVSMRSHRPGAANRSLDVTVPWWWPDNEPSLSAVPVPVISLDAGEIAAWARMVMGAGGVESLGVFAIPPTLPSNEATAGSGNGPHDAEERVRQYRVTVSPVAYRLAIYLSAVLRGRWGLGLARVVQEAVFPDSGRVHLAEVLVGGLVRQVERPEGQQEPTFEFIDGVGNVLQRSLTGTEALRMLEDLGGYIERETGRSPGIAALLLGKTAPADATGEFADVRTGAADLINAMGLARTEIVPEPAPAATDSVVELIGYVSLVAALAVSADGRVVTGGADGRVLVWDPDAPGSNPVELGRHVSLVAALAVSADGRVVTGGADERVLVWDLGVPGSNPVELGRHSAAVSALAVLPDGRVVTGGADGRVLLWDLSNPRISPLELGYYDGPVRALAVLPDGRVATGGTDGRVLVWDPGGPGSSPVWLGRHSAAVSALAVLPDGRVVTGGADGRVLVWDLAVPDSSPVELGRHSAAVSALAVLPDGRVATGGADGRVLVWDPSAPGISPVEVGYCDGSVRALAVLPDGRVVTAGGEGQLQVWDPARTGSVLNAPGAHDASTGAGRPTPLERYLVANLPRRVSQSSAASLVVEVSAGAPKDPATAVSVRLRDLAVGDDGALITVVVRMPTGLVPSESLSQVIQVPAAESSQPVSFPFRARDLGSQQMFISAWVGGSYLGEISIEVTVEGDQSTEERPNSGSPRDVWPQLGEVTLQVRFDGSEYTFQLLSESYLFEPVQARAITAEPSQAFERTIDTLRSISRSTEAYSAEVRRRLINQAGITLWNDLVPDLIKEQFWQLQSSISAFTIAADRDILPWELLYPLAPGRDEGFLVEQFPVMRRVYGQQRSRRIMIGGTRFVLPSRPQPSARDEITAIQRILTQGHEDAPTVSDLETLLELISSSNAGPLYFTDHGVTTNRGGTTIAMDGGPLVPALLNVAVMERAMASRQPLIFLPMCRDVGDVPEQTRVMGWAKQFMAAGAGAFVGTSWTVSSTSARTFAEAFYEALSDGVPLGEAIRRARLQIREDSSDPAWLAYTAYGDPAALAEALQDRPEPAVKAPRATASSGRKAPKSTDSARIIAVHGLGQQFAGPQVLRANWLPALQDGLELAGAEPLANEDLIVAFYGDLFRLTNSASIEEDAERLDQDLEEELIVPLWRAAATEEGMPGPESVSATGGQGLAQRAVHALNSSRFFTGLSERVLMDDLRQVRSYLQEPAIRQAAQDRVAARVSPETRVILAHSTGSIIAYEALCAHPEWDIRMFVTLGSPLGLRYVFDRLSPSPQNGIGSWPGSIRHWTNVADVHDIVALEKGLGTKFAGPVSDILIDNGARAHDLGPYLTAVQTGRAIAAGLAGLASLRPQMMAVKSRVWFPS